MSCHDLEGIAKVGAAYSHHYAFTKYGGWVAKGILQSHLDRQSTRHYEAQRRQNLSRSNLVSKSIIVTLRGLLDVQGSGGSLQIRM